VQPRTKYRLSDRRKSPWRALLWLLVLAGVIAGGWIWWHPRRSVTPPPVAKQPLVLPPIVVPPPPPPLKTNREVPLVAVKPPPRSPQVEPVLPNISSNVFPRPVQTVFEAQVALARLGISSGSIDGVVGLQTRAALSAFQQKEGLPVTGKLDAATKERLVLTSPPCATYTVTTNDLTRLQPLSTTWLGKSRQSALDYETLLELAAEKTHAHPKLIRQLNPSVDWKEVPPGTVLQLPDIASTNGSAKAAFAAISLSGRTLEAFDANTNLLAHFPCSIAQRVEKRPAGELHVSTIIPNPNYTFDPEVFPESPEAQQLKTKLVLPPGPNNPVGVAWVGLDKPGYGIHGTPSPEQVGRTESHGCFRLANWNAEHFLRLAWIGMPVYVQP
jgi:lipoprotein-anchoring transpeptidase ErfK/SrfK